MDPSTDRALAIGLRILEFVLAWGVSAATGAGLAVLILRTWVSEKIKNQIKSEYDEKLENLRARLKSEYDEKLETHKSQLKAQGDVEIEKLKSDLSIAAAQRQVQFSKLHERRAEVIAEVYASLKDVLAAIADYAKAFEPVGGTSREERSKKVVETSNAFTKLYEGKKIFIPLSAANKLDEFSQEIRSAYHQFVYGIEMSPDGLANRSQKWLEVVDKVDMLSKRAVTELECQFRKLLGDESNDGRPWLDG